MRLRKMSEVAFLGFALIACQRDAPENHEVAAELLGISVRDDMVDVPAGWFRAGCVPPRGELTVGCYEQSPPRDIWVSHFSIDRLEQSRKQYLVCVHAGVCTAPVMPNFYSASQYDSTSAVLPAEVTSEQAAAYCEWRGARLPTESEWQKAARGPTLRTFAWGNERADCANVAMYSDELSDVAWGSDVKCDIASVPARIGSHPKDRGYYGSLDMGGNVPEWTSSCRGCQRYHEIETTREDEWEYRFVEETVIDPPGFSCETALDGCDGKLAFVHGTMGGPHHHAIGGRPGFDGKLIPGEGHTAERPRYDNVAGIRCVRSLPGPKPPELTSEHRANRYRAKFRREGLHWAIDVVPSMFTPEDDATGEGADR